MRRSKAPEQPDGPYLAMPHAVLDSAAYLSLPHAAKALLFEALRQANGRNNGHLHLSVRWLEKRGWTSRRQIGMFVPMLLANGLILETRKGGLRNGPTLYAVTWLPISDYQGLDLKPGSFRPGNWKFAERQTGVSRVPKAGTGGDGFAVLKAGTQVTPEGAKTEYPSRVLRSTQAGSHAVPKAGTREAFLVPKPGTETPENGFLCVPALGTNVSCQSTSSFGDGVATGFEGAISPDLDTTKKRPIGGAS